MSAACRSSMTRTRGRPPASRVTVRASSSKICVRLSGAAADGTANLRYVAEHREDRGQIRREIRKVGGRRAAGVSQPEVLEEHLEEALVRESWIEFDGSPVQHPNLARLGKRLELIEQPRLADAGLSA